jgi:hypothetical protein
MNNLMDYYHMINTYVMCDEFDEDITECTCELLINCYQLNNLNKCKYYDLIINNVPLLEILLNPNTQKKFSLPNKWHSSELNIIDFFKIIYYIVNFTDKSADYIINKNNTRCVVSLSLFIIIINNKDIISNLLFIYKTLIINMLDKLKNNYLVDENNINKLNILFKKYFKNPNECIKSMHKWVEIMEELINKN